MRLKEKKPVAESASVPEAKHGTANQSGVRNPGNIADASGSAGEGGFRQPAWRGVPSTALFRAVNPELFIRPNKVVMGIGLALITGCVAYIGYLNATTENKKTYMALTEKDQLERRTKSSRWD